ncbi:MAG: hypothetical protein PHO12_01290 [Bacteroidales bacterium]|nr:hypothetical protein [Bacteroidales bacterium]MDD4684509.1 hypothetical protein [Bacteroidales bacterium]
MKRFILMLVLSLMAIPTINAQIQKRDQTCDASNRQGEKRHAMDNFTNKMKVNKIAYLTDKLDLSVEEAQKFWPIFNNYEDEMNAVREKMRPRDTTKEGFPMRPDFLKMTEKEAQDMINRHLKSKREIIDIQDKYSKEFKKAIPTQKIMMLFMLEKRYISDVIGKSWKNHRGDCTNNTNKTDRNPEGKRAKSHRR